MVQDLFWLLFHFPQFSAVACLAKFFVPIHPRCKLLGTACLQQSSMSAGLLLKFHTCNEPSSVTSLQVKKSVIALSLREMKGTVVLTFFFCFSCYPFFREKEGSVVGHIYF